MPDRPKIHASLLSRFFFLLGARGVRELFQAVFFIILARRSTTTYGEFMFAMGIAAVFLIMTEFGLSQFLVPHLTKDSRRGGMKLLQVLLIQAVLFGALFLASLWFISWQGYAGALRSVLTFFCLAAGLEALVNTFFAFLQVQGLQKTEAMIRSVAAAGGFGYALITLFMGFSPAVIALYRIVETAFSLGVLVGIWRHDLSFHGEFWRGLSGVFPSVIVFGFIEIAAVGTNKVNLFFLQRYGGAEAVAQYSATWQIVEGVSILVSGLLLQGVFYPLFARRWVVEKEEALRLGQEMARWLLVGALVGIYGLHVESDRLIPLLYGPQYSEAANLQKLLVFTIVFAFLHNLSLFIMLSMGLAKRVLAYFSGALAIHLVLCVALVPGNPAWGAALAMLLTKGALAIMTVSYCQIRLRLMAPKPLIQLLVSACIGAMLFFPGKAFLPRVAGEILALMPVLILSWIWWQQGQRGKRPPSGAQETRSTATKTSYRTDQEH